MKEERRRIKNTSEFNLNYQRLDGDAMEKTHTELSVYGAHLESLKDWKRSATLAKTKLTNTKPTL